MDLGGFAVCPLLACSFCADAAFKIQYPYVAPLWALGVLWLLAIVAAQLLAGRLPPSRWRSRLLIGFPVVTVVLSLAAIFFRGLTAAMAVQCVAWAGLVAVRMVAQLVQRPISRNAKAQLLLHLAFSAVAVVVAQNAIAKAETPEALVENLRSHATLVSRDVLPRLISRGDAAVGPLGKAIPPALKSGRADQLKHIAFALEKLCNREAEALLRGLVVEHAFVEKSDRWSAHAAFAYARCAGPRAADDLIAVHRRGLPEPAKAMVLTALVRTGSRRGVQYVLEHADELADAMQGEERTRVALVTLSLLHRHSGAELRELPLHRRSELASYDRSGFIDDFYWCDRSPSCAQPDAALAEQAWRQRPADLGVRWAAKLE